ncbi:MAG: SMC-Scp complex subunit ScpB [Candidatus Omnitrophota bacterium]
MIEQKELKRIIEAILFVSEKPVTLAELKDIVEETDAGLLKQAVDSLRDDYGKCDGGLRISEVAGGFRIATDPSLGIWLHKLYKARHTEKLTKPSLETLSIIAYKQPITRAEIEVIRGVAVEGVINTLLERGLIRIVGRKETVGRPLLYGTTNQFLEYFGLNSLNELPNLSEFEKVALEVLESQKDTLEQSEQAAASRATLASKKLSDSKTPLAVETPPDALQPKEPRDVEESTTVNE